MAIHAADVWVGQSDWKNNTKTAMPKCERAIVIAPPRSPSKIKDRFIKDFYSPLSNNRLPTLSIQMIAGKTARSCTMPIPPATSKGTVSPRIPILRTSVGP